MKKREVKVQAKLDDWESMFDSIMGRSETKFTAKPITTTLQDNMINTFS